jgi:hypothetical protein
MKTSSPSKVYAPANRCIYCDDITGPLGREHVIAFGLGGNLILPNASCKKCEKATCRAESICLDFMLGKLRHRLGLQSRNKRRKSKVIGLELRTDSGLSPTLLLDTATYPRMLALVRYPQPGILVGRPSDKLVVRMWHAVNKHDLASLPSDTSIRVNHFRHYPFCRMLAKIAHSYAAAELGQAFLGYEPMLTGIIREEDGVVPTDFVGGELDVPVAEPAVLHSLSRRHVCVNEEVYLVVTIRLFAFMGAPIYQAVVGRRINLALDG